MKLKLAGVALMCLALVGCVGIPLKGRMYDVQTGEQMEFVIHTSFGNGKMTASDPRTGETFEGEYSGIIDRSGVVTGTVNNKPVLLHTGNGHANARGILRGSKGTVIQVVLDIKPGARPRGNGEGVDQRGNRYQIHF
ncbi:hypothetical protein [Nibricoccus sp. IMCC34717]|uniref:hypothetical protein n=1 Tax=Nibricoccus sp. IMCC34717 TaxID=3034021 RepID=UPI00384FF20C